MASAATNLCPALSLGILAFAPLGPAYYHIGVYAGFASAIWGHLAAGLFGGAAHPGSGPAARADADPRKPRRGAVLPIAARRPRATQEPAAIVAIAASDQWVIAGMLQIVARRVWRGQLGALRSVSVRRRLHVPARRALIILTQLGAARRHVRTRGLGARRRPPRGQALQPATLFVGITTAATIWAIGARCEAVCRRRSSD